MKNPHRRGRLFEPFVSQILEEEGYDVSFNPQSAPPRQTDLFASREGQSFLIDAKWFAKPIHVGHVSAVRERLRKCPPDVFGCIFSMSGYTTTAEQEICSDRNPEIHLFSENEIRGIASDALRFGDLLDHKRDQIRRNSTVWFSDWTPEKAEPPSIEKGPEVIRLKGHTTGCVFSTTRGDDVLFARDLLDFSGTHDNSVFSLDLRLHISTITDLHRLLRLVKKHLGLEGADSFAIHQRNAGWYGLGAESFLSSAKNWKRRYADLGWDSYHHSEEIAYFDRLTDGGLVCLTSRQRVGQQVYLHSSYLQVFFPGIPVDLSAVRRLCKITNNPDATLEHVQKNPVDQIQFHPRVLIKPIGTIVCETDDIPMVTGVIAKNPFFGKPVPTAEGTSLGHSLRFLSNNEHLLCSMAQWHPAGAEGHKYEIRYAEACWIGHIPVLHVACDWMS
jgi:restriction endonuclease